jgi:hypothetical protein
VYGTTTRRFNRAALGPDPVFRVDAAWTLPSAPRHAKPMIHARERFGIVAPRIDNRRGAHRAGVHDPRQPRHDRAAGSGRADEAAPRAFTHATAGVRQGIEAV